MTSKRDYGKIIHEGAGGFLCPPTHPMHKWSVKSSYGDTFFMCLETAAYDSPWLNADTRVRAKQILAAWKPLPITDVSVQDWIRQVLGYFRNCYQAENGSWKAGELRILKQGEALPYDKHAGVHLIRKYYPDYYPSVQELSEAYWGTKPGLSEPTTPSHVG